MAISKLILNGQVQMDVTSDTVTTDKLMQGYTAHDRTGAVITGTAVDPNVRTATITNTGDANYCYVMYPSSSGTKYYTDGDTFAIEEGNIIYIKSGNNYDGGSIYVNDIRVAYDTFDPVYYSYEVPANTNIEITITFGTDSTIRLNEVFDEISITQNGRYDVSEYDYANVNVSGGGGSDAEDGIISRTISGAYVNSRVTTIGEYAFFLCSNLTMASFPNVTQIYKNAFESCANLTTISFPNATRISSDAFGYCSNLTTANFPNVTSLSGYAFYICSNLSVASFPKLTLLPERTFYMCSNLATISFTNLQTIGFSAFQSCISLSDLSELNFPNVRTISASAFYYCGGLTTVSLPNVELIQSNAFGYCPNLTTVSFPNVSTISSYAFRNCYNLLSVYLLGSQVPSLPYSNTFSSTPIAGYITSTGGVYGSIFVPSSLYDSYITATNWSLYSDRIVSV